MPTRKKKSSTTTKGSRSRGSESSARNMGTENEGYEKGSRSPAGESGYGSQNRSRDDDMMIEGDKE